MVRRALANIALMLAALVLAFAAGEVAVRALFKEQTVLFPRYHTDFQYGPYRIRGIRPNSDYWMTSVDGSWRVVTNSRGLRNGKDYSYEKEPGRFRVLSIGDSHTQGYEVRQDFTYSATLERFLRRRSVDAEVLNAGVSGFSTAEALVFLENEGIRYRPDAVALGFFANDFEDNLKADLFRLDEAGTLVEHKHEHLPGVGIQNAIYSVAAVRWLSENSYFYSVLFNNVWSFFKARLARSAAQSVGEGTQQAAGTDRVFEMAVATGGSASEHEMALATALLVRMQRFCSQRGIRFIVIDIPSAPGPGRFESSIPAPVRARLAAEGIEVMDSRAVFGDYEGVAELHAPNGHHHISEFVHTHIGVELGRRLVGIAGSPPRERVR